MDWLVYHFVKDVLVHYWYVVQCKLYGFIKNGKVEGIVANVIIRTLEIMTSMFLLMKMRMLLTLLQRPISLLYG